MNLAREVVVRFLIVLDLIFVAFPALAEEALVPKGWTLARADEAARAMDCFFQISSKPIATKDQNKHRIEESYHRVRIEKEQLILWDKSYTEKSVSRPCGNARESYSAGSAIVVGKEFLRNNSIPIDGARLTKRIFDVSDVFEMNGGYSFYFKESIYDKPPDLGGWICFPRIDEISIIAFMRFEGVGVNFQYAVVKQINPVVQGYCSAPKEKP